MIRGAAGKASIDGTTLATLSAFLLLLLALCWLMIWSEATRKVDRLLHDTWVRASQHEAPEDIVIAAIDTESLEQLGRWPWPRNVQALLYEQLARRGARAVIADLIYSEPAARRADDENLAKALGSLEIAILPVLTEGGRSRAAREILPLAEFTRSVTNLGHIALPLDDDGIVRRVYLKSGFGRPHWPQLSVAALAAMDPGGGWQGDSLPGRRLPLPDNAQLSWVEDHEVLIPFAGPRGAFSRLSAVDIIRGKTPKADIEGKIVLVGMTTTGLGDVVPTPVSALDQPLPGVEIHANVLAALRDGRLVGVANPWLGLLVAGLLLPALLLSYSRIQPQWSLAVAAVVAIVPIALSGLLYHFGRLWYPPFTASVIILFSYLWWSRSRLEFISRFLASESAKLAVHIPSVDRRDNHLLAEFFNHAGRHLPIVGWRFNAGGQSFQGGVALSELSGGVPLVPGQPWRIEGSRMRKAYATPDALTIELEVSQEEIVGGLTAYVDSLLRIRSRTRPSRFGTSIERLQESALRLSDQVDWMRGVKVFSDTLLHGTPIGFMVWNPAGEMVRGNQLVQKMLPALNDEPMFIDFVRAVGRQPREGDDKTHFEALMWRGEPWQVRCQQGDSELIVSFSAVGKSLEKRLLCASIVDVSAVRVAERARAEMVDYLSHDLRSPLISAMYLTDEDAISDLDPEDRAERIRKHIQISLGMMDDLLHVARADGLTEDQFSEVLMNAVVDNALDNLLTQAQVRRIGLQLECVDDELWVDGDAALLERAVMNIVGNAIKYSDSGCSVRVDLSSHDGSVVLKVLDEGVGIDPEMMDSLFTRFRRDPTTRDRYEGTGLGLALVSRVVSQHRGEVSADSSASGTCLTLTLPLKQFDVEVEEEPQHETAV